MEDEKAQALALLDIVPRMETQTIEREVYCGYGDETSARVAAYNYTTVTESITVPAITRRERSAAFRQLRKILRRIPDRDFVLDCRKRIEPYRSQKVARWKSMTLGLLLLTAVVGVLWSCWRFGS